MKAKISFYVANLISGSSDSRPSNITNSDLGKPEHINELVKKQQVMLCNRYNIRVRSVWDLQGEPL